MSYAELHLDAKTAIARTSIGVWNALMRSDPVFGRYALSDRGRSAFIAAFTVVENNRWTINGILHRTDGQPALIQVNGTKSWHERGQLHRIATPGMPGSGGPARIFPTEGEEWFEYGERHRADGQPACTYSNGTKVWYERNKMHRIGGPAFITDSSESWYENGRLHRIGGPARTRADGTVEYWERGQRQLVRV